MKWQADLQRQWAEISSRIVSGTDSTLRFAVLAAHPDDETIGASALLARFPRSLVVYLTDGAPRDRRFWPAQVEGTSAQYAELRRKECAAALAHAGIESRQTFWLGGVDQEAIFDVHRLAEKFAGFLAEHVPHAVVTHSYEGGHPDHDAAALIARLAVTHADRECPILEMTSYHAHGGQCVTGEFLPAEAPEIVLELAEEDRRRKQRMLDDYASQRLVLESFPVGNERLRLAPEYEFTLPPHEGKLWYECMGWPVTGARWREVAAAYGPELKMRSSAGEGDRATLVS